MNDYIDRQSQSTKSSPSIFVRIPPKRDMPSKPCAIVEISDDDQSNSSSPKILPTYLQKYESEDDLFGDVMLFSIHNISIKHSSFIQ